MVILVPPGALRLTKPGAALGVAEPEIDPPNVPAGESVVGDELGFRLSLRVAPGVGMVGPLP